MKRALSLLPLLFFIALVAMSGYFLWEGEAPTQAALAPTATLTPPPFPSPSPNSPTPTPTRVPPTPTPTLPAVVTVTPTLTATPALTTTTEPPLLIWVSTDNNPIDPVHTLGLAGPDGENPILQTYAAAPALAPDGQRLAFFSESSLAGLNTGIWVADIIDNTTANHQLLTDVTNVQNIVWSPDGDKLAFEVVVNPEDPPESWRSQVRISRADPEDGYVELGAFDGRQPAWSPDSQQVVAQSCKGSECGLLIVRCQGDSCDYENAERITEDVSDSFPTWSTHDDIAFTSNRDGNQEIYLLRLADSRLQNLTQRVGSDITPVFSPTGQQIYFRTDASEEDWQIQAITLTNNRQAVLSIDPVQSGLGHDNLNWGLVRPAVQ